MSLLDRLHHFLFSDTRRAQVEKTILGVAILGFILHLAAIYLGRWGFLPIDTSTQLLDDPIAAAYTPFSFILIYEVYLLLYYLPRSITTYIAKQYEIITLIIVRRLFKDLASVEISANWFEIKGDVQFTYDLIASVILFYLLFLFNQQGRKRMELSGSSDASARNLERFIQLKKGIATFLIPILFGLAAYTLVTWSVGTFVPGSELSTSFSNINNIFFDDFFGILIIVDVILLLCSFFLANDFHKVFRNSGFVISTILIRLSFSVEGLVSVILVVASVIFGLIVLWIYNQYEKANLASRTT